MQINISSCLCNFGYIAQSTKDIASGQIEPAQCVPKPVDPAPPPICSAAAGANTLKPIIPSTGEKHLYETDFTDSSAHPLNVQRSYMSQLASNTPFGSRWTWNHQMALRIDYSQVPNLAKLHMPDGSFRNFRNKTGNWDSFSPGTLTRSINASGAEEHTYQPVASDNRYLFNAQGQLIRQTERNGWSYQYNYNAQGQLSTITNQFGRSLQLAYNTEGRVAQITTPDSQFINYQYDSNGRLILAGYPDNSLKKYQYESLTDGMLLTGVTDENNIRLSTYSYDALGRAIDTTKSAGTDRFQVSYATSANGVAILGATITDPLGTSRTYAYSTQLAQLAVTSADKPSGQGLADAASRVQSALGLIERETDFLGFTTQYQWDTTRRLPISVTQAAGRPEQQIVSTQWHPAISLPSRITEQGKITAYTHDSAGNILTQLETDTTGNASNGQTRTWAFTYSPQNLPMTMTDPCGQVWTFTYDTAGNRTSITNPLGHITTNTFDGAGRVLTETAPNGLVTTYAYDPRGRVTRITRGSNLAAALQQITVYTYRPSGQIASAALPNGHALTYTYDDAQRLIGALDNRGNSIAYVLDPMGNRTSETIKDASQQIALASSRVINSLNRVQSIQGGTNPSAQTTAFQYDANGEPIQSTNPLGNFTKIGLDALRRPITTTLADNSIASQAYNQLNHLTSAKDPKAVQTNFQRNAWGEVLSETSPDIGTVIYTRDAGGNVLSKKDAKNQTTSYQYDALSRITNITFADAKQHNFFYDGTATGQQIGMLREMTDASGNTKYERDTFGRITKKMQTVSDNPTNPTVLITQYTYDKSELASIRYPSGLSIAYPRNASGQITSLTTKIGTAATLPFVQNLTYTALGQPKAWNWAHCTTATTAISPCTSAIRSFDQDARMTASNIAAYQYDSNSRITAITQNLYAQRSVSTGSGTATITTTQLYQQPVSWAIGYDNRDRISSFARIPTSGNTLGSIPAAQQSSNSEAYTYDPNSNRLSSITINSTDTDKDGLFETSEQRKNTTRLLNVQPTSNKLLGFTQTLTTITGTKTNSTVASAVNYTLDANGNLTSDGLRDFRYDGSDRLSKVILGSTFVGTDTIAGNELAAHTYLHNAAGQRVFKSEPKTETTVPNSATLGTEFVTWLQTNFSWMYATAQTNATLGTSYSYADGQIPSWALLGEYGNGGANSTGRTEYIWLPTQDGSAIPIGMYRGGKFYAIHSDHLGTPRLMVDNTNQPVWQWAYSGFGDNAPMGILKPTTAAASAFTSIPAIAGSGTTTATLLAVSAPTQVNNLRGLGQYFDSETGHFYNTYRTLMPSQGRYTQPDPIGLDGGWNQFGYVGGNPLSFTDPLGLQAIPFPPIFPPVPGTGNPGSDIADQLRRRGDDPTKTYQTYTRYNPKTGLCYTGRTSGYGSPEDNVRRRGYGQPLLNAEGFLPPVLDRSSTSSNSIRGREQLVIDLNGGARSTGGLSRNAINGISPINPAGPVLYTPSAIREFGIPLSGPDPCTCQ